MRGIAVILVVFYHLKIFGFNNGFLGVDIFFVLSGYLMTRYDNYDFLQFYSRRLKRLVPAYIVTIIVTTAIVSLITVPSDANQRFERFWYDILGLSNFAFWVNSTYFEKTTFKPLLNLWSLAVEFQFYILVPLLYQYFRNRLKFLIFIIIISMVLTLITLNISPKTSFFMMPFRIWKFMLGAITAWYPLKLKSKQVERNFFICLGIFLLFFIVLVPLNSTNSLV